MTKLSHFDEAGQAHMVDVSGKDATHRVALACGEIHMNRTAFEHVARGTSSKGDVLGIARVAAIMAAKRTSDLIPLCHPLLLHRVQVDFEPLSSPALGWACRARVETVGETGVEMEALTAVQVGLLTMYDMLKAVDKSMVMREVCLLEKLGGKSGAYRRASTID